MSLNAKKESAIENLIAFVWQNNCQWYANLWRTHGLTAKPAIQHVTELTKLPIISKADFLKSNHPFEYTFIPTKEVVAFRSTSGTTGKELFVFPRKNFSPDIRDQLKADGAAIFMYLGGVHKNASTILDYAHKDMHLVTGDAHAPDKTVRSAVVNQVDTISATPTALNMLAPFMKQYDYAHHLERIVLYGELCTQASLKRIEEQYPHAQIYTEYSLSESGQGIGYTTPQCDLGLNCYHVRESAHCEVVDDELVITTLTTPHPLPLIRYRTGDTAHLQEHSCSCGHPDPQVFELTGRKNVDWVRVGGLELRYSALEKALEQLPSTILVDAIHATVETRNAGQIEIHIFVALSEETKVAADIALPLLLDTIQDHWFLSQAKNLAHYIAINQCVQPTIHHIDAADQTALKKTGIKLITA